MNRAKKLLSILLILCLILGTLMMSSCNLLSFILTGSIIPPIPNTGDNQTNTDGTHVGDIYVEGGDTNHITITPSTSSNALAASKAVLSVVSIAAEFEQTSSSLLRPTTHKYHQYGSGVIYKMDKEKGDAYIITNYHVISSASDNSKSKIARNISLYIYGMEFADYAIKAEFVGGSMTNDLAVLKVSASPVLMSSIATAADIADSNKVAILETAIAIGNPDAAGISATLGYISVDSETISILGADDRTVLSLRVIRTDTAINPGNSGGGLFNDKGELIGIVNAKDRSNEGMGYAIPSNVAKAMADNIIDNCDGNTKTSAKTARIGVTVNAEKTFAIYDQESGKVMKQETVTVGYITSSSIMTNLLKLDDEITSIKIGGVEYSITRTFQLGETLINARVGDTVEFNIVRDGVEQTVSIELPESCFADVK